MGLAGHEHVGELACRLDAGERHIMTVRVESLDALGSSSRLLPTLRTLSTAATALLTSWWHRRSVLVMSDEWMKEYRWSSRDR